MPQLCDRLQGTDVPSAITLVGTCGRVTVTIPPAERVRISCIPDNLRTVWCGKFRLEGWWSARKTGYGGWQRLSRRKRPTALQQRVVRSEKRVQLPKQFFA